MSKRLSYDMLSEEEKLRFREFVHQSWEAGEAIRQGAEHHESFRERIPHLLTLGGSAVVGLGTVSKAFYRLLEAEFSKEMFLRKMQRRYGCTEQDNPSFERRNHSVHAGPERRSTIMLARGR